MRILLVEDEASVAEPLAEALAREGMTVAWVDTGRAALAAPAPDVVLLDLRLPDMDGRTLLGALRARGDVPVIIVTASGGEDDRVLGLGSGADDYVVKPFSARELAARIRAVVRRGAARQGDGLLVAGPLEVDRRGRRVRLRGHEVAVTRAEFDLLAALACAPGETLGPARLSASLATGGPLNARSVQFHVASLRRKLGDPAWIETVRGVGVRLRVPG